MHRHLPKLLSTLIIELLLIFVLSNRATRAGAADVVLHNLISSASGDPFSITEEEAAKTLLDPPTVSESLEAGAWENWLSQPAKQMEATALSPVFEAMAGDEIELVAPIQTRASVNMRHVHENGTLAIGIELHEYPGAFGFFQRESDGSISGHLIWEKSRSGLVFSPSETPGHLDLVGRKLEEMMCARIDTGKLLTGLRPETEESVAESAPAAQSGSQSAGIPILQSLPGASKVIYLDFDGETVSGTPWNVQYNNGNPIVGAPFANPEAATDIWKAVSEDYRPFNVNVTTDRSVFNATASRNRSMAIMTPSKAWYGNAGGVAFTGSYGGSGNYMCWVFNSGTNAAAESASHETGHQLGLNHDGSAASSYYSGHTHTTGITWAPIMGLSYGKSISQFSKGEYPGADEKQDDLAVIAKMLPYRADDHGNEIESATLAPDLNSGRLDLAGVIEKETDVDVVRIPLARTGTLTFHLSPDSSFTNLDLQLDIISPTGVTLASSAPANTFAASVSVSNQPSGNYYLVVSGTALGTTANGYSKYGSIGSYRLTGTFPATGKPVAPVNLTATDGTLRLHVDLAWDPAAHANQYTVYRSTSPLGNTYAEIARTASTTFRDTTVPADSVYRYYVTSQNPLGDSPKSSIDTGFRQDVPSTPLSLTASDSRYSTHTLVQWSTATRATGYRIYRNTSASFAGASEIGFMEDRTTFEDRSGLAGESYHYFVIAVNAAGDSAESGLDTGSRTAALTSPAGITATQGEIEGSVLVRFGNVSNAKTYSVFRSLTSDPRDAIRLGNTTGREFYDKTAAAGATYYYFARAEGNGGDSALSASVIGVAGAATRGDDNYEPNDRQDEATPLQSVESIWLSQWSGMAVARDADWYSLASHPSGDVIEVLLRQSAGSARVDLALIDDTGATLATGTQAGINQILSYESITPERNYFLLVTPTEAGFASYNLLWRCVHTGESNNRSDLSIGKTSRSQVGDFVYETKARSQKVKHQVRGAKSAKAFATTVNEGTKTASVAAKGSKSSRYLSLTYYARSAGRLKNVTGAMRSRGYSSEVAPLESTSYEIHARPGKAKSRSKKPISASISTSIGGVANQDSGALLYSIK